ncbi:MAG: cupin domain-containing protein [Actinomycetota bacterium]
MPIERPADHPTFELGGNAITSYAAPARGSVEVALYRADVPPGGGLPPHTHDHFDVFTVVAGGGVFHLGDDTAELAVGDSAVVPVGVRHFLEAGSEGASIIVAMHPGTRLIRDDGVGAIPEWVR